MDYVQHVSYFIINCCYYILVKGESELFQLSEILFFFVNVIVTMNKL
jgi:hypothetical protein